MLTLTPIPGLSFLAEEKGKPCHKHMLNGVEIPGCTSVSGLFQDDGWKFAWPVKLMAEKIIEQAMEEFKQESSAAYGWGIEHIAEVVLRHKNAWRQTRDSAADKGTDAHAIIEQYIKSHILPLPVKDLEVQHCVDQFMLWKEKCKPEFVASEVQVGSAKHRFAGILDALAIINGRLTLLDFKTSGEIKDEYTIQLAGLCLGLEEMGVRVDARAILHLPKEGDYEFRYIRSNLEWDKEDFLAALNFYNHKNGFMGRMKSDRRSEREAKSFARGHKANTRKV